MSGIDYYEVLDIAKTATTEQIKAAHRKLVRIAHPDQGGDAIQFRLVQEAYETLHDLAKRAAYDTANGMTHAAASSPPHSARPVWPTNTSRQTPQPPSPPPTPRHPAASGRTSPPWQPPRPATFPGSAATPAPSHQRHRTQRSGSPRPATAVFWLTAGVTLGLVVLTMIASMPADTLGNWIVVLWGILPIGYVVWWLMNRRVSLALAISAHSYTVFMAVCVAFAFVGHFTGYGIFLAAQVAGLAAVPVTGRIHRRRAR